MVAWDRDYLDCFFYYLLAFDFVLQICSLVSCVSLFFLVFLFFLLQLVIFVSSGFGVLLIIILIFYALHNFLLVFSSFSSYDFPFLHIFYGCIDIL